MNPPPVNTEGVLGADRFFGGPTTKVVPLETPLARSPLVDEQVEAHGVELAAAGWIRHTSPRGLYYWLAPSTNTWYRQEVAIKVLRKPQKYVTDRTIDTA